MLLHGTEIRDLTIPVSKLEAGAIPSATMITDDPTNLNSIDDRSGVYVGGAAPIKNTFHFTGSVPAFSFMLINTYGTGQIVGNRITSDYITVANNSSADIIDNHIDAPSGATLTASGTSSIFSNFIWGSDFTGTTTNNNLGRNFVLGAGSTSLDSTNSSFIHGGAITIGTNLTFNTEYIGVFNSSNINVTPVAANVSRANIFGINTLAVDETFNNTSVFSKVRLGLGTGGALPADQSSPRVLGFDPATGIVSDELFPAPIPPIPPIFVTRTGPVGGANQLYRSDLTAPTGMNGTIDALMMVTNSNQQDSIYGNYNSGSVWLGNSSGSIFGDFTGTNTNVAENAVFNSTIVLASVGESTSTVKNNVWLNAKSGTIRAGLSLAANTSIERSGFLNVDDADFYVSGAGTSFKQLFSINGSRDTFSILTGGLTMKNVLFVNNYQTTFNPTVSHSNTTLIGLNNVALSGDYNNTVIMPKLVLGKGTNGALPTTGATNGLGISTTGEVISTPLPGGAGAPGAFTTDVNGNILPSTSTFALPPTANNNIFATPGYHSYLPYFVNASQNVSIGPAVPYHYAASTNTFSSNIIGSTTAFGIYEQAYGGDIHYNILMGDAIGLNTIAGGLGDIRANIVLGQGALVTGALTTSSGDTNGNIIIGNGRVRTYGAIGSLDNVIVGTTNANIIDDSRNNFIFGANGAVINGDSRFNTVVGTGALTIAAQDNTTSPTVWMPKLKLGQGTGGALPTTGATNSLGISATGEVISRQLGAFGEFADTNVSLISSNEPWGSTTLTTSMILAATAGYNFDRMTSGDFNTWIGAAPRVYSTTVPNASYNTWIGASQTSGILVTYGTGTVGSNIMIGDALVFSAAGSSGNTLSNISIGGGRFGPNEATTLNTSDNINIGDNRIRSTIASAATDNIAITSAQSNIYGGISNSIIGSVGGVTLTDVQRSTIIGVGTFTLTGVDNTTTPTVYMPRLVLGRGTGGALPTTGGTNGLEINGTTGAVIQVPRGAFVDESGIVSRRAFTTPSITNGTELILLRNKSSYGSFNLDYSNGTALIGNTNNIQIHGHSSQGSFDYVTSNTAISTSTTIMRAGVLNTYGQVSNNIDLSGVSNTLDANNYDTTIARTTMINATGTKITGNVNYSAFNGNVFIGTNLLYLNSPSSGSTFYNSVFIGSERVTLSPTVTTGNVLMFGVQYSTQTTITADLSNNVLMPKLRLGRGTNGALPTTGGTRMLGFNPTTGVVSDEPIPSGGGGSFSQDVSGNISETSQSFTFGSYANNWTVFGVKTSTGFNNMSGDTNVLIGSHPIYFSTIPYTDHSTTKENLFFTTSSQSIGIYNPYTASTQTFEQNILFGNSYNFRAPNATGNFEQNLGIGMSYGADFSKGSTSTHHLYDNINIGGGSINVTSAATFAVRRNMILSSRGSTITNSQEIAFINAQQSNSTGGRKNTLIGTNSLTVNTDNNTTPTVYMPRLVVGRGTGGNLVSGGATYMLGYNQTTGVVSRESIPSATPAGATTQVQFNNAGAFAGNSSFTFDVLTSNTKVSVSDASSRLPLSSGNHSTVLSTLVGNLGYTSGAAMTKSAMIASSITPYTTGTNFTATYSLISASLISQAKVFRGTLTQSAILATDGPTLDTANSMVNSAIIGGSDHIVTGALNNSAIIGGVAITASVNATIFMPKVRLGLGAGGALPIDQSPTRMLGFDPATGIVSNEAIPDIVGTTTFTPTLAGITPTSISGHYSRSGDICTVNIKIDVGTTASSTIVQIGNLPFTPEASFGTSRHIGSVVVKTSTGRPENFWLILANTGDLFLWGDSGATAATAAVLSEVSNKLIDLTITYNIDNP